MAKIELKFFNPQCPELALTKFSHPLLKGDRISIRGSTTGGTTATGSFPWSTGVKALCILLLRNCAGHARTSSNKPPRALLVGRKGSPAVALDHAMSKESLWLVDMFGMDSKGHLIAKGLFLRINPEMKRHGPVIVVLKESALNQEDISVYLEGVLVTDIETLFSMAESIEESITVGVHAKEAGDASLHSDLLRMVA